MPVGVESPRYWLDLFTEETWLEAARRGFTVSGFTQHRWATVQQIRPNDILVCYLTGRSTYVGLLRVTGPPFLDETPLWASQVFPSRLPVTPELVFRPDVGISIHSLSGQLSYFRHLTNPHAWTGHFRGSPAAIKPEDAAVIEGALRNAAADPARLLDLANLPEPTQRRRKRRPPAPDETVSVIEPTLEPQSSQVTSGAAPAVHILEKEEEGLAKRLVQAATASEDASGFESALAEAFAYLGFRTELRSGPGDTDVLAVAPLGADAYAVVVMASRVA